MGYTLTNCPVFWDHLNDYGGSEDNHSSGPGDEDHLHGGFGNDILRGSSGFDALDGGAGIDTIHVYGDNDVLLGGDEDDVLSGGSGNNKLDLSANVNVNNFGNLTVVTEGNNVRLLGPETYGEYTVDITINGAAGQIDASDFIF